MRQRRIQAITSRDNPAVRAMAKLVADPAFRRQTGEFAAEGTVMLSEALRAGADVTAVFFDRQRPPDKALLAALPESADIIETEERILASLSDVKTPQGVVFRCRTPRREAGIPASGGLLVLDEIRDPGNMGAILRTADAFFPRVAGVALCGRCVDPFNPKAVRATMGAIFRCNFFFVGRDALCALLAEAGMPLYAAAVSPDALDVRDARLSRAAVAVGNEAAGVSDELTRLAQGRLMIPISGRAESLNAAVAASILLWEMARPNRTDG